MFSRIAVSISRPAAWQHWQSVQDPPRQRIKPRFRRATSLVGCMQGWAALIQVCHEAYLGLNPCCFGCKVLSWPRYIRQRRAHRKQDDVQDKRQILVDFRKRSGNPAKR